MDNNEYLSEWECKIKETIIPNKYNFNDMLLYCQESLSQLPDTDVNKKISKKLQSIKRPRKKYLSEQFINWCGYDIKN
jgi:dsDNA-specific endonuclease/ATPase MutS2